MTTVLASTTTVRSAIPARSMSYPGAPQIMFAPETGSTTTTSNTDDAAAQAAAAAAAVAAAAAKAEADKIASDAAAAEAAAAAAAEKAANDKAIEDARKAGGDEAAKLLREVMDKKAKLKEAEAEKATLAEQLKQFEGINVTEVRELLKQKADADRAEAERKGEFERVKAMMVVEHEKSTTALQALIDAAKQETSAKDRQINDLTIGTSFATSPFITSETTLAPNTAKALFGQHFDLVDNQLVGYDKPTGAAARTPLVDAAGKNLPFEDAMRRIVDLSPDKATLLRSTLKPGGNSKTTTTDTKKREPGDLYGISRISASLAAGK